MSDILEVSFEEIAESKVVEFFLALISLSKKILNMNCSEDAEIDINDKDSLIEVLTSSENLTITVNLGEVSIGSLTVVTAMVRLLKYGEQYDIELSWEPTDMDVMGTTTYIKKFHTHVKKLADDYNVASYYAGMEPASDEETRYFTGEVLGPLI